MRTSGNQFDIQLKLNGVLRGPIAVNRDAELFCQDTEALNVIAVFVRDENAGQVFWRTSDGSESLTNLTGTESGVDEDPGLRSLDIRAISRPNRFPESSDEQAPADLIQANSGEQRFSNVSW